MTSILPVILVVDDEPDAVRLIKLNLEARGYEVVTASNSAEALRVSDENHIDLVVLNLTLPDMHGFEVCQKLIASSPNVIIIMVQLAIDLRMWPRKSLGHHDLDPFERCYASITSSTKFW